MNDLFGKERLLIVRQDDLVRDHVIYEISPHRSGVAQVIDLNWGRTMRQNFRPTAGGEAFQIDSDVDLLLVEKRGDLAVALRADIVELVEGADQAPTQRALIGRAERDAEHFEASAVVPLEQLRHQVGGRVFMKIR